jgi:N-acetylmuramoyl-L-alanine amidase
LGRLGVGRGERRIMIGLWRHTGSAVLAIAALLLVVLVADVRSAWSQNSAAPAKPAPVSCERAKFLVAIDVGHTLAVPGAISARGETEYSFNLRLGQSIKQALLAAGFDKTVLMITSTAPPRGLLERAVRANKMHADLFIAIHHDSVPDNLLQTWTFDGRQLHYNDNYPGYAIFVSNENVERAASLAFGHLLGEALQARGLGYTPHYILPLMGHRRRELLDAEAGVYRYDQLVVLKDTRMPAVLLEAGSIVNRNEELALASPERVALESAAVAAAVEDFCNARAARPERTVKRPLARSAAAQTRPARGVPR